MELVNASIDDIKHDLNMIEKEFEHDSLMQPLSYARTKELYARKEKLTSELNRRYQSINR